MKKVGLFIAFLVCCAPMNLYDRPWSVTATSVDGNIICVGQANIDQSATGSLSSVFEGACMIDGVVSVGLERLTIHDDTNKLELVIVDVDDIVCNFTHDKIVSYVDCTTDSWFVHLQMIGGFSGSYHPKIP